MQLPHQPLERQQTLNLVQEEGASGFFSGAELAGLRGALGALDRSTGSKTYTSNAQETYMGRVPASAFESQHRESVGESVGYDGKTTSDLSLIDCQGLLSQALRPNSIFDLPTAVTELQKALKQIQGLNTCVQEYQILDQENKLKLQMANEQNEQLHQELIQLEGEKLQIEQEMLELVEQRKQTKQENAALQESVAHQAQLSANLKQQLDEARDRLGDL